MRRRRARRGASVGAWHDRPPMKRLVQAPNAAIATLWADLLRQAGIATSVQRYFTGSIAGEIPPDQALPEVWVLDDDEHARAAFQDLGQLHRVLQALDRAVDDEAARCERAHDRRQARARATSSSTAGRRRLPPAPMM